MKKKLLKKQKKREQFIKNISILVWWFALALGVHLLIINNSHIVSQLKTSINESKQSRNIVQLKADLYLEQWEPGIVQLKSAQAIENLDSLSLSLRYNPDYLEILDIKPSNPKTKILNLANIPGINTALLQWGRSENINPWSTLLHIYTKKKVDTLSSLTLLIDTIEFSDKKPPYSPTTSWIQF